jgi:hypothetical protein
LWRANVLVFNFKFNWIGELRYSGIQPCLNFNFKKTYLP